MPTNRYRLTLYASVRNLFRVGANRQQKAITELVPFITRCNTQNPRTQANKRKTPIKTFADSKRSSELEDDSRVAAGA